jgi:hypothetical protein
MADVGDFKLRKAIEVMCPERIPEFEFGTRHRHSAERAVWFALEGRFS